MNNIFCSLFAATLLVSLGWAQDTTSPDHSANSVPTNVEPQNLSIELITKVDPEYPSAAAEQKLGGDVILKIEIAESGDVEGEQVLSGNAVLATAAMSAAKQWKFKPFLRQGQPVKISIQLPFKFVPPSTGPIVIRAMRTSDAASKRPAQSSASDTVANAAKPVRVDQKIMQAFQLPHSHMVGYPPAARQAHVQGDVKLNVLIGKDGVVKHVEVISGPEQLTDSALQDVEHWSYRPFVLNNQPIEVETTVTVTYRIAG